MKNTLLTLFVTAIAGSALAQTNIVIESFDFNTDGVLPSADPDIDYYNADGASTEPAIYSVSGGVLEQRSSTINGNASYNSFYDQLTSTQSLSLEAEVDILTITALGGVYFQAFDGANRYTLFFEPSGIQISTPSGLVAVPLNVTGTHSYRVETPANSSTANLFVDDTFFYSWEAASDNSLNGFGFGDAYYANRGADANWNYLTLTQDVALTPVPEPSTYALLLGLAGIVGVGLGRRKRSLSLRMKASALLTLILGMAASLSHANITVPTIFVGDAGNPNDITGYGSVGYTYYIGTYEVTNTQYSNFLNAVASTDTHNLYNTNMASGFGGITRSGSSGSYTYTLISGRENMPVNYVSFWDAARFTNWLSTGNTETGVYNLGGVTVPSNSTITRDATAWANGGVAIASENEWYKAAYYSGTPTGADGDGYWLYPTQDNSISTTDANYNLSVGDLTVVGAYSANPSYYGTFDQGGNVWEINDQIIGTSNRGLRGSGYSGSAASMESTLRPTTSPYNSPTSESSFSGFRVTSLTPVPEPATYAAILGLGAIGIVLVRKRRRQG